LLKVTLKWTNDGNPTNIFCKSELFAEKIFDKCIAGSLAHRKGNYPEKEYFCEILVYRHGLVY
jgi:hypothetical protein